MKRITLPNGARVSKRVETPCDHVDRGPDHRGGTRCSKRAAWCVYRRWTQQGRKGIAFDYYCEEHWNVPGADGKTPKEHAEKET